MKMNGINFYKNRYGVIETNLIKYNKRHLTKINGERIMMKLIAEALILMLILTIAGYALWRLRLPILWAWRKWRAKRKEL